MKNKYIVQDKQTEQFFPIIEKNGNLIVDKEHPLHKMFDRRFYVRNGETEKYVKFAYVS